jgi:hypothetical protein
VAAGVGGERVGEPLGTHQGSIWVLGWGRKGCQRGGPRLPAAAAAGALAPARRLHGGVREQEGEQQQGQERVEGTIVGAHGRWNLGSPQWSSLAPAERLGQGRRARASSLAVPPFIGVAPGPEQWMDRWFAVAGRRGGHGAW